VHLASGDLIRCNFCANHAKVAGPYLRGGASSSSSSALPKLAVCFRAGPGCTFIVLHAWEVKALPHAGSGSGIDVLEAVVLH
jgi:hypothetical protein